jgi:hemerythrin-like domain-containing protein
MNYRRRDLLVISTLAGASMLLPGARALAKEEKETGAVEDLMREHGVLRRALLVYDACARRLRAGDANVPGDALVKTAQLFRNFGEDYHERKVEEEHIFPVVRRVKGAASHYPDVLTAQHERGREITDYIIARSGRLNAGSAVEFAQVLESFTLMYEHHTAREDTIVFTAWKSALSEKALDEMGEKFEAIEHAQFGKDGFDDAAQTMSAIEQTLGIADISQFTSPAPPRQT